MTCRVLPIDIQIGSLDMTLLCGGEYEAMLECAEAAGVGDVYRCIQAPGEYDDDGNVNEDKENIMDFSDKNSDLPLSKPSQSSWAIIKEPA